VRPKVFPLAAIRTKKVRQAGVRAPSRRGPSADRMTRGRVRRALIWQDSGDLEGSEWVGAGRTAWNHDAYPRRRPKIVAQVAEPNYGTRSIYVAHQWSPDKRLRHQPMLMGVVGCSRSRRHVELDEDVAEMSLDRLLAEHQGACDVGVAPAFGHHEAARGTGCRRPCTADPRKLDEAEAVRSLPVEIAKTAAPKPTSANDRSVPLRMRVRTLCCYLVKPGRSRVKEQSDTHGRLTKMSELTTRSSTGLVTSTLAHAGKRHDEHCDVRSDACNASVRDLISPVCICILVVTDPGLPPLG
jgi:hypothetical protein